jgi:riboflavin synthase
MMFTGIVTAKGTVVARTPTDGGALLRIDDATTAHGLSVGSSVALGGVCLTAVAVEGTWFEVEAVAETLRRTNLGGLEAGGRINLERPVSASALLEGHVVQGHVDGVGTVRSVEAEGDSRRVWVDVDPDLLRYVAIKGSVAVDGVSLTVTAVDDHGFEVALIPHTLEVTTFGDVRAGTRVNVEVDILAKYIERAAIGRGSNEVSACGKPKPHPWAAHWRALLERLLEAAR